MDLVHSWGVELAVYLQTRHGAYRDLFHRASALADLHTTFFFFFPIWFHLRREAALRLVWVAVLGDWLNLVLKWYRRVGGVCECGGAWGGTGDQGASLLTAFPPAGFCSGSGPTGGSRRPASMEPAPDPACSSSPSPVRPDQVRFRAVQERRGRGSEPLALI